MLKNKGVIFLARFSTNTIFAFKNKVSTVCAIMDDNVKKNDDTQNISHY